MTPEGVPDLCASCIMTPGWFRNEAIRAVVDPDMDVSKIPEHER